MRGPIIPQEKIKYTRWTHMRLLHKKSSLARMFAKIPITLQGLSCPEVVKISMDVWKDHMRPTPASSTLSSSTSTTTTSGTQDEHAVGRMMEPQAHNLRVLPRSLNKSVVFQWDATLLILLHWNNFKFVSGAQSGLVIALKLFQNKDIFSVSSLTHPTGFVFAVCNTAASTDTLKRNVIETKRFTPRSNFSLLYNWNWSTGTKQAIWNDKQTYRKSIRNTDLKKINKHPVLHACSPELALKSTFFSCLLWPPRFSVLWLPSPKLKVVVDLSYFSHTAQ